YLFRNINKVTIKNFLNEFELMYDKDLQIDSFGNSNRYILKFVNQYINQTNIDWDIAIYSGEGNTNTKIGNVNIRNQIRTVICKDSYIEVNNRQVSSGSAEAITLSKEDKGRIKSNRRE